MPVSHPISFPSKRRHHVSRTFIPFIMMARSTILSLAFALGVAAQTTSYTDANTGITFAGYSDTTGYIAGIAMPETLGTDFIAQIVAPMTDGAGWAGLDLGSAMTERLLIATWPNDDTVMASFREATDYVTPPVYTNSSVSMLPISSGTFINSTHLSYTFVCKGCITGDILTFSNTATSNVFSWALCASAVTDATDDSTALPYHAAGASEFSVTFTDAASADYDTWAAMGSTSTTSTSSNNSTSTTSTSSSNSTATYSNSTASATSTATASANLTTTVFNTTYDYIVAGAGAAGIIVAQRLVESGASVLLIERGEASLASSGGTDMVSWNNSVTQYDVPALGYYLTSANDTSEYCTDTASMAGCILGGSTMVNALMWVRPQTKDFDDKWPTGWKWSDVEESANKLYDRNPGTLLPSADGKYYDQAAYDVLVAFFSKNGWSSVNALTSPNEKTMVYSHPPWNIQDGERAGPVKTYLPLAKAASNFEMKLNTKVIRAIRKGTAISGVEVETSPNARQIININAGGRVILAAGTLSTPRILFNSGIGPAAQIEIVQNGSTQVTLPDSADWIDLPVGENLRDHPIFTVNFKTTSGNLTALPSTSFTTPTLNDTSMFAKGSGLLTQAGQRLNFWTSINNTDGERFFQGTTHATADNNIQMKIYLTHGLTSTGVLGIESSGSTTFTTTPWMNTDADKTAITTFIDQLLTYTRASGSGLVYVDTTGAVNANISAADIIGTYVSGDHFVGTAKMGTDSGLLNGTSVVDTNTQVYGTDNLFVVDGSFHPDLPTGNTQAIIMVAAEHAAAKILALNNGTGAATVSTGSGSASVSSVADISSTAVAAVSSTTVAAVSSFTTAASTSVITASAGEIITVTQSTDVVSVTTVTEALGSVITVTASAGTSLITASAGDVVTVTQSTAITSATTVTETAGTVITVTAYPQRPTRSAAFSTSQNAAASASAPATTSLITASAGEVVAVTKATVLTTVTTVTETLGTVITVTESGAASTITATAGDVLTITQSTASLSITTVTETAGAVITATVSASDNAATLSIGSASATAISASATTSASTSVITASAGEVVTVTQSAGNVVVTTVTETAGATITATESAATAATETEAVSATQTEAALPTQTPADDECVYDDDE